MRADRADAGHVEAPAPAAAGQVPAPASAGDLARDALRDKWMEAAAFYGDGARAMLAANPENAEKLKAWTPEAFQKLGYALARCAERYGWKIGEEIDHPIAAAVIAAAPLAWPFLAPLVMPRIQAMVQRQPAPAAVPGEAPAAAAPLL